MLAMRLLLFILLLPNCVYAQTGLSKSPEVRKVTSPKSVDINWDRSKLFVTRALPLDNKNNHGLNFILYSGDTININQFFLRKAAKGKADLYYDIRSEAKLSQENIQLLMLDSSMTVDNLLVYEQWLPDYNTMEMGVKLVALAPAHKLSDTDYQPLYWMIYYDQYKMLKNYRIPYPDNGTNQITLYNFFERRKFMSVKLNQEIR